MRKTWKQRVASALLGMMLGVTIPSMLVAPVIPAYATDATLLPNAKQQYFDDAGNPVANGTINYYVPSTTTRKTVWQNADKTTLQSNPVLLDAAGRPQPAGQTFGDGVYRQQVRDANNVVIWDALTTSTGGGGVTPVTPTTGDGLVVGSVLPWSGLVALPNYVFAYGQAIARVDYPLFLSTITMQTNAVCTSGLNVLSGIADTQNIKISSKIEATCLPPGTTVTAIAANSVTMSANATVSTVVTATFFPWGNGNGSTTFNVPDLRGQTLMGRTNMGGTPTSVVTSTFFGSNPQGLGSNGGSQSFALTTPNLPAYTPAGTVTNGAITSIFTGTANQQALGPGGGTEAWAGAGTLGHTTPSGTVASSQASSTFAGTAQGGTGVSVSLIQPTVGMNYIVKVLPDTSTVVSSGVDSVGGMTGVLACGSGLVCGSQTISVIPATTTAITANQIVAGSGSSIVGVSNFTVCNSADNSGSTDTTAALQACLDTSTNVRIKGGTYSISSFLNLHNGQHVLMGPDVSIIQSTKNTLIFYAIGVSNITIEANGAILQGKGIYCGNPGQGVTVSCPSGQVVGNVNDVAIYLDTGTSNVWIDSVHTKNTAGGGIFIVNSSHVKITNLFAEGTNLYTTAIVADANYQSGVVETGSTDVSIINPELTGTAQGILLGDGASTRKVQIVSPNCHDITGQHCVYASRGGINITNPRCTNVKDACIKAQIQTAGQDSYNFVATGIVSDTATGNCVEVGVFPDAPFFATGFHNLEFSGVCKGSDRAISIGGPVTNMVANIQAQDTISETVLLQGRDQKDIDITITSLRSGKEGISVSSTNSSNIRFHQPLIRDPSTAAPGQSAALIASASAAVTFYDLYFADSLGNMLHGLHNSTVGSTVQAYGSVYISGATNTCVTATGSITAWPIWVTLSCTGGGYTAPVNTVRGPLGDTSIPFTNLVMGGSSTGTLNLRAAAVSGTSDIRFPNGTTDFSATGGTSQVVKQVTAGAPFTVGQLACADLSGGCASNLTVGTTTIASGTNLAILYNNAGLLGNFVTLPAANFPALTGDVTTSAGSLTTVLANIPTGTPAVGTILHTNIAAPSSPAAGKVSVYSDSTDLRFHDKNAAGTIGTTVVADTGSSNNFLTAISAAGVISKAQPSISNLSGFGTGVATALGVNVGTAGAFVVNGGALGSPSSAGTIPAFTLGGTISGGGNALNNIVIGGVTPLASTFTVATANSFVPNSSTVPSNGLYLPASNTLGWAINSAAEIQLTSTALSPAVDGGNSLGTATFGWQNLFGNTGFILNIEGGDWVATHTTGILTVGTGDLRVTTAGTNSASAVTIGGTQELTNKTLNASVGKGTWTASGTWTLPAFTLGGAISGGGNNITNVNVGTSSPGTGAFTTVTASTSFSGPTYTASGALAFQSNGTTAAGSISTGQQWVLGNSTTAPSGPVLTVTKNTGTLPVVGSISPMVQTAQADDTQTATILQSFSSDGLKQPNLIFAKARGTSTAPTAVQSGDFLGANFAYGYATSGATGYVTGAGAGFIMTALENYTSTAAGAALDIYTTNIGSASVNQRARFHGAGGLSIGDSTAPGAGGLRATGATIQFTALASDAAQTDNTICVNSSGTLLKGSGTLGICLGTSSERYKNRIDGIMDGLDEVLKLRPVNFYYNANTGHDTSKVQYGFTAEQVFRVLPALVDTDTLGRPNTVDILGMVPILVRSIQQLKAENDNLRMDVLALQSKKQQKLRK